MSPVQSLKKILLLLLGLLSLTTLIGCVTKSNRFGIVFIEINNGATDIYRIPDNTPDKIEQLTFTPTVGEGVLLVSKNGDKIILGTGPTELSAKPSDLAVEELHRIYFLDTPSKKLKDITDMFTSPPTITPPMQVADWSPDQKQFVFITYETGLGIMDFDGTNRKDVSIPSLGEIPNIKHIKWSPNGKKLALTRGVVGIDQQLQNPGDALLVYDLESEKLTQLADYETNCFSSPVWSPTSQQIAATCSYILPYTESPAPDTIRIFSTENPGQPYERLLLSPCKDPSWSPDGKQLAFVCDKGADQAGLFIINSDGNGIHEVKLGDLENPAVLKDPIWSPDGTQIIYVAGADSGHTNIYSIHPDGSNNHPLTNQEAFYSIVSVYPIP